MVYQINDKLKFMRKQNSYFQQYLVYTICDIENDFVYFKEVPMLGFNYDFLISSFAKLSKIKYKGVYFIEFEKGTKVGISDDILSRLLAYQSPWCQKIYAITIFLCNNSIELEKKIKGYFSEYTTKGSTEYFESVSLDSLLTKAKIYNPVHKGRIFNVHTETLSILGNTYHYDKKIERYDKSIDYLNY